MTGRHDIQFSVLQEKYFEKREKKYLSEMYLICYELSKIYIKKYASNRGLYLDIDLHAHDSAVYIISRYITDKDFMLIPLSGYLFTCCNHIMWSDKTWDKRKVSLEDWMKFEEENL
jgi:hypothetical protein